MYDTWPLTQNIHLIWYVNQTKLLCASGEILLQHDYIMLKYSMSTIHTLPNVFKYSGQFCLH